MDSWTVKALRTGYSVRSLWKQGNEGQLAPYVRLFIIASAAVLGILAIIEMIVQSVGIGLICLLIGVVIALAEVVSMFPVVARHLEFFLENYLYRAIAFSILAVPTFFTLVTFVGGIMIVGGSVAYAYCVFKGEKPNFQPPEQDPEAIEGPPTEGTEETSFF